MHFNYHISKDTIKKYGDQAKHQLNLHGFTAEFGYRDSRCLWMDDCPLVFANDDRLYHVGHFSLDRFQSDFYCLFHRDTYRRNIRVPLCLTSFQ